MEIGDAIEVSPYGRNRHVGIVTKTTKDATYCNEWYGLEVPNRVEHGGFYKNVIKKNK